MSVYSTLDSRFEGPRLLRHARVRRKDTHTTVHVHVSCVLSIISQEIFSLSSIFHLGIRSLTMDSEEVLEEMPSFRSVALLSAAPSLRQQPSPLDQGLKASSPMAVGTTKHLATKSTTSSVSLDTAPLQQHGWKLPVLTDLGCFSFLEPYHKHISIARLESLLQFLPRLFQQLSLHVEYCDSPIVARATTLEQVGLCVSVVRDINRQGQVVLQVQRRVGCCIVFTKYAREIIQRVEDFVMGKHETPVKQPISGDWTSMVSSAFKTPPPHCHGTTAQTVLQRCHFREQQPHQVQYHFYDLQETSVLDDTNAMLQCFATRHLALEALTILTDPAKTTKSVVDQVSRVLLCGEESTGDVYTKLVGTVVLLAVSGRWMDDDDNDSMPLGCDDRAQFLALQALVNAMHVVDCASGKAMSSFNQACRLHTDRDWEHVLCERFHAAAHQPHVAYLAAKGLCRLHEQPSQGVTMASHSKTSLVDPAAAKRAMLCPHAALQAASQQLLYHLGG